METENKLFPGRANYTGPEAGWFGLLHHDKLFEESHNVMERVAYVKHEKSKREIAIRLHNMICLNDCAATAQYKSLTDAYHAQRKSLTDAYYAQCKPLDDAYHAQCKPLTDAYYAQYKSLTDAYYAQCKPLDDEILAYIRKHIPDCAWDGKELVFGG